MLGQGPRGEQEASARVDGTEKAGWSRSVRGGGEAVCQVSARGPHLRGKLRPDRCAGKSRTAGPPDVSVFHREDVGWWRSWLQQSYQAVKEKVSRAGALPPAGPRSASLQPGPSGPARPTWAPGLRDEAHRALLLYLIGVRED